MASAKLYYAIQFLRSPYWTTDKFTVVPSTWVSHHENQAMVAFPMLEKKEFSKRIKNRKPPCKNWQIFPVTVEYKANVYDHVVLYIELRKKIRSFYMMSIPQQIAQGIEFVDAKSTLNSSEEISTVNKTRISQMATEHDLIARILDKIREVNRLLEQYTEMKLK